MKYAVSIDNIVVITKKMNKELEKLIKYNTTLEEIIKGSSVDMKAFPTLFRPLISTQVCASSQQHESNPKVTVAPYLHKTLGAALSYAQPAAVRAACAALNSENKTLDNTKTDKPLPEPREANAYW